VDPGTDPLAGGGRRVLQIVDTNLNHYEAIRNPDKQLLGLIYLR